MRAFTAKGGWYGADSLGRTQKMLVQYVDDSNMAVGEPQPVVLQDQLDAALKLLQDQASAAHINRHTV